MIRAWIVPCLALLTVVAARGQESQGKQQDDPLRQVPSKTEMQKTARRMPGRDSGIVADNLDRVAATANQILEILNQDAGLMVELKRTLAEDAGASGQILEESDLSESAVNQRLVEDLHSRVLATRLLQRYGYLLPRVNPDSDIAAEHNLQMRARAQQLERTALSTVHTRKRWRSLRRSATLRSTALSTARIQKCCRSLRGLNWTWQKLTGRRRGNQCRPRWRSALIMACLRKHRIP